jgi:hypothetical protein
MKITKKLLEKWGACPGGYDWFNETFPRGCSLAVRKNVEKWLKEHPRDSRKIRKRWLADLLAVMCMNPDKKNFDYCRDMVDHEDVNSVGSDLLDYIGKDTLHYIEITDSWGALNLGCFLFDLSYKRLTECTLQVAVRVKR